MEHLLALWQYASTHVLGIFFSLIASYVVGTLWHGPIFGKLWMECNDMKAPKKEDMKFSMMLPGLSANFVLMIVLCTVLGRTFQLVSLTGVGQALLITTILWLPFTALTIINTYAWSGKRVVLMALDAGYYLVSFWVTAAILYYTL